MIPMNWDRGGRGNGLANRHYNEGRGLRKRRKSASSADHLAERYSQPLNGSIEKAARFPDVEALGVNPPTPKLRRETPLRRAKTGFRPPSHPQARPKNPQISWGSTSQIRLERKMGLWSLEQRSKPETNIRWASKVAAANSGYLDA